MSFEESALDDNELDGDKFADGEEEEEEEEERPDVDPEDEEEL